MELGGAVVVLLFLAVLAGCAALAWRLRESLPHLRLLPREPSIVSIERWDTALEAERARELLAARGVTALVWVDKGPEFAYRGRRPGAHLEVKATDAERAVAMLRDHADHQHARRSKASRR